MFLEKDFLSQETAAKLRITISWLLETLQRSLFPKSKQCWDIPENETLVASVQRLYSYRMQREAGREICKTKMLPAITLEPVTTKNQIREES